jgi:phage virion morphogenesis protein
MAAIEISAGQLDQLIARVSRASRAGLSELLDAVGQQQEDAARKRITDTKKAPDGTSWKAWSRDYAKTRGPQHSLLQGEGDLADTMTHQLDVGSAAVLVGSPMVYAAAQLYGDGGIPSRPFLDTDGGFADPEDRDEIRDIVETWLSEAFAA